MPGEKPKSEKTDSAKARLRFSYSAWKMKQEYEKIEEIRRQRIEAAFERPFDPKRVKELEEKESPDTSHDAEAP